MSCKALEVWRWSTYLAGGSSPGEPRARRTGPAALSTPLASNGNKTVPNGHAHAQSIVPLRLCPSVYSEVNDDNRESVQGKDPDAG